MPSLEIQEPRPKWIPFAPCGLLQPIPMPNSVPITVNPKLMCLIYPVVLFGMG